MCRCLLLLCCVMLSWCYVLCSNMTYDWQASPWSACVYRKPRECCRCFKQRSAQCVLKDHGVSKLIPPFYCRKLPDPEPHESEPCEGCTQDCVHSTWADWSQCSETCNPATRHRTRTVLVLPTTDGRECGPLMEVETCNKLPRCEFVDKRPKYRWNVGSWTSCRRADDEVDLCGAGQFHRKVFCTDKHGTPLADDFCLQYMQGQNKPKWIDSCTMPCPCEVTAWSLWSACSQTCVDPGDATIAGGYQTRAREVVSEAQVGAVQCPHLTERSACNNVPKCDRYVWQVDSWDECTMRASADTQCGSGLQSRDVTCVLEGDMTLVSVDSNMCREDRGVPPMSRLRPPAVRACEVPCAQDCQLGEWEAWSVCSQSCGRGGQKIRRKRVLMEATPGGKECSERFDTAECEQTECAWWNIGQWSACFLTDYEASCGEGAQIRNVYCISAMDVVLPDENCTTDRPSGERECKVPCEGECDLSEWSEWTPCTKSCGFPGGAQTRNRTPTGSKPMCVPDYQLTDTRVCNQRPCDLYTWAVTPWSVCLLRADGGGNSSLGCGKPGSGERLRHVQCQSAQAGVMPPDNCAPQRPEDSQECAATCPQDCELGSWQDWSACGDTCGQPPRKYRYLSVERIALYGGSRCDEADDDGMVVESRECKQGTPCLQYAWNMTEWSGCHTLTSCGRGVMERQVYCVRPDGRLVDQGECLNNILQSPPPNQMPCYKPCDSDCLFTEWSTFSECSVTCGKNAGVKTRFRSLVHPDPTMPLSSQCPSHTEADLLESQPCQDKLCPDYDWEVGDWTSCVADSRKECGPGIQKRQVFCKGSDEHHTSTEKCGGLSPMPEVFRQCEVFCQVDCEVSEWEVWGPCSHNCGFGLSQRVRTVTRRAQNGGRKCPSLTQNRSCQDYECADFMWDIGEWAACHPYFSQKCGDGQRTRAVECPAGKAMEPECRRRVQKASVLQNCRVPCTDDCDVSEWSSWSVCDCSQNNSSRSRIRDILTEAGSQGNECGPLKSVEMCECPGYRLVIGNWTVCRPHREECGPGTRDRWVQCIRQTDGANMPLSYCTIGNVQVVEDCDVVCPRDCRLTDWSGWSSCRKSCGVDAVRQRSKDVVRRSNRHGRSCPVREALTQRVTCESVPCFEYSWEHTQWTDCSVDLQKKCGLGTKTRHNVCRRSDAFVVNKNFCGIKPAGLLKENFWVSDETQHSDQRPTLKQTEPCGFPCPGDCVMSSWSTYGPCFTSCKDGKNRGFQTRSRTVLSPAEGGQTCPNNWVEKRVCNSATCPYFYWKVRAWDTQGRRKVYCSPDVGDFKVYGGCREFERPARKLDCNPRCGMYANCLEGDCVCQTGFIGDGYLCLPEYGCHANLHCIVNNSYCDPNNKECLCLDGTLPTQDMYCAAISNEKQGGFSVVIIYILIGCLCAVILLAACIAICFLSRKRRPEKLVPDSTPTSPGLAKIDNLEMERNNTLLHQRKEDEPTYPSHKSDYSDRSDIKAMKKGRDGMPPSTSMPLYYEHNLNLEPNSPIHDGPGHEGIVPVVGKSLNHLDPQLSYHQGAPYIANVQPQPRSASAVPYINYVSQTPTPSDSGVSTFKPDEDSPWHVVIRPDPHHQPSPHSSSPSPRIGSSGGGPGSGGSSRRPSAGIITSPSGHLLYRVPENREASPHPMAGGHDEPDGSPSPPVPTMPLLTPSSPMGHLLSSRHTPSPHPSHHHHHHHPHHTAPSPIPTHRSASPHSLTHLPPIRLHNPADLAEDTHPVHRPLPSTPGGFIPNGQPHRPQPGNHTAGPIPNGRPHSRNHRHILPYTTGTSDSPLAASSYNSLPRSQGSSRPSHHHQQAPTEVQHNHNNNNPVKADHRHTHSDDQGLSFANKKTNPPHNKYGSLPSKGKQLTAKNDAAQNLLDYCDALLADLEHVASS